MKTPIWVYIVVVLLSAGAGLAIAGIPDTSPREPTIIPPVTTDAPADTDASAGEGDQGSETDGEAAPDTTVETTVAPTTTEAVETTTTEATTTTVPELAERDAIEVTIANGAGIGGIAGQTAEVLAELGYTNTITRDGLEITSQTFVYSPAELEEWAERLADEIGLPGGRVRPLDQAPSVDSTDEPEVLLYVGEDIQLILVSL